MFFRGKYAFLSNFFCSPLVVNGIRYTCVEAAFQSFKTTDRDLRRRFSALCGKDAKRMGQSVPLRPDWDNIKEDVMLRLLRIKFSDVRLREELLSVSGEIVEENFWRDCFWGVDAKTGKGENRLGKLLMQVREEIRGKSLPDKRNGTHGV